jgi:hypothetical protein
MWDLHLSRRKAAAALVAVLLPLASTGIAIEAGPWLVERLAVGAETGDPAVTAGKSVVVADVHVPPGSTSPGGVGGTTQQDLDAFAAAFNDQRAAHSLEPVQAANFRYDPCMEQRLFWMAEDPSPDVASAWGHLGSQRSDGVPSVGCDGNLAGGPHDTGETVAVKWCTASRCTSHPTSAAWRPSASTSR